MSTPSSRERTSSGPLTRRRFSSPLIEVVLCVVQPQAHSHRVALPALSENVVHSSVPAQRPRDWGSLGGLRENRDKRMTLSLFPQDRGVSAGMGSVARETVVVCEGFGQRTTPGLEEQEGLEV